MRWTRLPFGRSQLAVLVAAGALVVTAGCQPITPGPGSGGSATQPGLTAPSTSATEDHSQHGGGPSNGTQPGPSGGPKIDVSKPFPTGIRGSSQQLIGPSETAFVRGQEGIGKMGVLCGYSHMGFFDPIVKPGQRTGSHLHTFYGNMDLNENTTKDNIMSGGKGSCRPGVLDLSGYWIPTLIDTRHDTPARPDEVLAYYRSGYSGLDHTKMENPPVGLKIIAGNAGAKEAHTDFRQGAWSCTYPEPQNLRPRNQQVARVNVPQWDRSSINPACPSGYMLNLEFFTPQCWNGELDSADHKSHLVYDNNGKCPSTHSRLLPTLSTVFRVQVPAGATGKDLRLSSDMYETSKPGGYSLHMDWFNGWDPKTMEKWMSFCIRAGRDCINAPSEKERWMTYDEKPSNEIP